MKLSTQALQKINNKQTRLKLALALDVTERWIELSIEGNKDDGILTKATALKVIRKETGLRQAEILNKVVEAAN